MEKSKASKHVCDGTHCCDNRVAKHGKALINISIQIFSFAPFNDFPNLKSKEIPV